MNAPMGKACFIYLILLLPELMLAAEMPGPDSNGLRNGYIRPIIRAADTCRSVTASSTTFSFSATTRRITRSSGSFLGDGMTDWQPLIVVTGSSSNNGTYRAENIQAGYISVFEGLSTETDATGVTVKIEYDCLNVPTSADQTITTASSWASINWTAGNVIAFREGDYISKGTLNCGGSGTAGNETWLIHEDALSGGINNGVGYFGLGSMTHPANDADNMRVKIRGFDFEDPCDNIIIYGLSFIGQSADDVSVRWTFDSGSNSLIANVYCDGTDLKAVSRCFFFGSGDPDDVTIQHTHMIGGEPVYNNDQDLIGINGTISNDRLHFISNEIKSGRITHGGATSGTPTAKNSVIINNDIWVSSDNYVDCADAKTPTCGGGGACSTGEHMDASMFDPAGECQAREGLLSYKGGCEAQQYCVFGYNRIWGMRPKPPNVGGTSSLWHVPRCLGGTFVGQNILYVRNICHDLNGGFDAHWTTDPNGVQRLEVVDNIFDGSYDGYYDVGFPYPPQLYINNKGNKNSLHHNLFIGNDNANFNWYYITTGSDDNEFKCNTIINGTRRGTKGLSLDADYNAYLVDTGSSVNLGETNKYENSSLSAMNFSSYCFRRKLITENESYCIDDVNWSSDSPSGWSTLCNGMSLNSGYGLH